MTQGGASQARRLGRQRRQPLQFKLSSATTNGTEKFTGYFREAETGNDYAVNRYMSPGYGRFLTADPSMGDVDFTNPGSWNAYAYVLGDPANLSDPNGLDVVATPPVVTGPPDCGTLFINFGISQGYPAADSLADLFNSNLGVLTVMSYFEQEGTGTQADENVWTALDWTFVNRYQLPYATKLALYGSAAAIPSTFVNTVTYPGAAQVFSGGALTLANDNLLLDILTGPQNSGSCNGLITALAVAIGVIGDNSTAGFLPDPVPGAIYFGSNGGKSPQAGSAVGLPITDQGNKWSFYAMKPIPVVRRPLKPRTPPKR